MSIDHVLVVDDSRSARLVLSKLLQNRNITVEQKESAEEALEYLTTNHPDAIFMDHMMKGADGLRATKIIKSNPNTAMIPIAMYTSQDDEDYRTTARTHGAAGILVKPPSPEALGAVLEELEAAAESGARRNETPAATAATAAPKAHQSDVSSENIEKIVYRIVDAAINQAIEQKILPLLEQRIAETRDDMIAITQTNTELAIDNGIHKLVFPRIEERVAELRKYVVTNGRTTAESVINHTMASQVNPMLEHKLAEFGKHIQINNEKTASVIAGKHYDANVKKLFSKVSALINEKVTDLENKLNEPRKIDPESFNELLDKARSAAGRKVNETAEKIAEHTASDVAHQIVGDVQANVKANNIRLYIMTMLAAIVGVGAAAAVYFLK